MSFYVYTLHRPCGQPFYVGMGQGDRIHKHEEMARYGDRSHKSNVIRKIWGAGGEIAKRVVSNHQSARSAKAAEMMLIARIGRLDLKTGPLVNKTAGGDGVHGMSGDLKAMHATATKRGMASPETKEKCRQHLLRMRADPVTAERLSTGIKEYWLDPKNREAQSRRIKLVLSDPVVRERVAEARRKGLAKPEVRLKMRLAKLGKKQAPEAIAKRVAKCRGKKRTPEQCQRISQAKLAAFAARRLQATI